MDAQTVVGQPGWSTAAGERVRTVLSNQIVAQAAIVFLAYIVAGKLGQATTNIRSGNLGPVWPASGIALASLLAFGYRVWPAVAAGAFIVAFQSPVPALTAVGQAAGAVSEAMVGALLLRQVAHFDPRLSRLRDAIAFLIFAFCGAACSASIGMFSLFATGLQSYTGIGQAWLIYWLGDATGVLLVTPLVFTVPAFVAAESRRGSVARTLELAALAALLTATCVFVFGDLPFMPIRVHVLAFAVLPFVMWAAIDFGIAGASLSIFLTAAAATLFTALGSGPFALDTPFVNAALLDVLFVVLAVSGLTLAAVIAEREQAESERQRLIGLQAALDTRLRLAAIVESSNDAIVSTNLDGRIQSWNAAAERIFGFSAAEMFGNTCDLILPRALRDEDHAALERLKAGRQINRYETVRLKKDGTPLNVSITLSPLWDASGQLIGAAKILRDITSQKQAEAALSSLGRRLLEAQEHERARIARELHDDIGQRLSTLAVFLTDLPEFHQKTTEIAADVQALSHRLHSSRLDLLGLRGAMKHLCEEFAAQHKVAVDFSADPMPDQLPPDVALCLFRIAQEALHNAAKHSGAHHLAVALARCGGEIQLRVRDDGRGFDVDAARTGRGIGLISMEERIKLVNGELLIESEPSRGTTVHARVRVVPLDAA